MAIFVEQFVIPWMVMRVKVNCTPMGIMMLWFCSQTLVFGLLIRIFSVSTSNEDHVNLSLSVSNPLSLHEVSWADNSFDLDQENVSEN